MKNVCFYSKNEGSVNFKCLSNKSVVKQCKVKMNIKIGNFVFLKIFLNSKIECEAN